MHTFREYDDVSVKAGNFATAVCVTPGDVGQVLTYTAAVAEVDFGGNETLLVPVSQLQHHPNE